MGTGAEIALRFREHRDFKTGLLCTKPLPKALAEKSSTQQAPYVTSAIMIISASVYFSKISAMVVANIVKPSGICSATLFALADLMRHTVFGIYNQENKWG